MTRVTVASVRVRLGELIEDLDGAGYGAMADELRVLADRWR